MRQRGQILIYGALALAIIVGIGFIGRAIYNAGAESERLECQRRAIEQRDKELKQGSDAAEKKEKGDAKAKIVYRAITEKVDKYIDRPVYRNECFDADGLRDANAALRGATTPATEPNKPMPESGAAK